MALTLASHWMKIDLVDELLRRERCAFTFVEQVPQGAYQCSCERLRPWSYGRLIVAARTKELICSFGMMLSIFIKIRCITCI